MEPWRREAACLGKPLAWFFPERANPDDSSRGALPDDEPEDEEAAALARAVCRQCPVAADCINYAVTNRIKHGFWGCGGDRRRHLRRLYLAAERSEPNAKAAYRDALAAEVETLRGVHERAWEPMHRCERCARQGLESWVPAGRHPEDRNSIGARCGYGVTYARGCRCWFCRLAHSERFQGRRPKPPPPQPKKEEPNRWLIALMAA